MSHRFHCIAQNLDVGPLLKKIHEHEHLWAERTERQNYPGSAHAQTETIYLRWAVDETVYGGFYDLRSQDRVETIKQLSPSIYQMISCALYPLKQLHGQSDIGRVILTRMKPGAVITEHIDEGPYADKYDRFHVCLSGMSNFIVEGERQIMRPGDLWWFNHKLPHRVENFDTAGDRIHLIIDLVAPEYRAKRGLTFQRERAVDLWDEITPLLQRHYEEICHYKHLRLNPDMQSYNALEESGHVRCYTARMNGELIGYCVWLLKYNLHYKDSLQALQDVLFIVPEHRGGRAGLKLVRFCEGKLREEGVDILYHHIKVSTPKTVEMFRKMGYEEIDVIMGKRLEMEAS